MNDYPTRNVLQGIPWIGFYRGGKRCPEDIILPSVMRSVLEYLGESGAGPREYGCKHCLAKNPDCSVLCTYAYLVGVSGAATFLSWKDGWHGDNVAPFYMSADHEAPEKRIFRAVGYQWEWVDKERGHDEAVFRRRIAESIQRGMPVLGYGVVGPPEASIIAGYDDSGDTLIGWSFFQDPKADTEPSGYFRQRDWFENTLALLIIGDKLEKPSIKESCRDALHWILHVTRTPMVRPEPDAPEHYRNRHNGLAAYMAWAAHLLNDEAWPADDESVLRAHHQIHNDAVGTVAEARWYGSVFLAQIVEGFEGGPGRAGKQADILHAAACYAAEHDLMWEIWELAGGIGNQEAHRAMANPNVRRAMAEIVRQAREQDARAADHIERALA
jgi:hypothetical protein